jgi:hypothetical protein
MGYLDWFRRRAEKPKPDRPQQKKAGGYPELVLLMEEPLHVGVKFVQGAVEHAFRIALPTGTRDSTEFVTGDFPFFFVQFGGRLLQLKLLSFPYFSEKSAPFAAADPRPVLQQAREQGMDEVIDGHRAWIAVWFMNSTNPPGTDDPYSYVGRMLAAFAIGPTLAIVWPARNQIRQWSPDMLEALEAGEPLRLFGE